MIITIDTTILDNYGINANEFVLLHRIDENSDLYIDQDSLDALRYKGLLLFDGLGNHTLTQKALDLIGSKKNKKQIWEDGFLEFWNTYPVMAGKRVLRTKDINTKQYSVCKDKYKKTCYEKLDNIPNVLKGLKGYLNLSKGKEEFIVGIEVFLNQCIWEKYYNLNILPVITERVNRI